MLANFVSNRSYISYSCHRNDCRLSRSLLMNFKCFTAERASESDSITNEDSSDNQISMNQNTTTAHDGATTIKPQDDKGKDVQDELSDVNVTVD